MQVKVQMDIMKVNKIFLTAQLNILCIFSITL